MSILRFIARRLAISIPILAIASFLVFWLVAAAGDPLANLREQSGVSQAALDARAAELRLNDPVWVRWADWLGGLLRGDLGSGLDGEPVIDKLARAGAVTLRMVMVAGVIAVVLAVVVGVLSAVRKHTAFDHGTTVFAFVCFSMPVFFLAGLLKDIGIWINEATGYFVFATVGASGNGDPGTLAGRVSDVATHTALPALTLILVTFAAWSRYQRASMIEVMESDFIRTARAKGASERRVLVKHGLRNGLIPLTTVVAIDFAMLINGSIVVEQVYAWQGLGQLFINALREGDVYVSSAWLLLAATSVVAFNLVADLLYAVLDPRITHA